MHLFLTNENLVDKLRYMSINNGFNDLEDYIFSILEKEIIFFEINKLFPLVIERINNLKVGSIFTVIDLIGFDVKVGESLQLFWELESIFEIYLSKANRENDFEILFLDEKTYVYTYLKK